MFQIFLAMLPFGLSDSLPEIPTFQKERIDTVSTFDFETEKEEVYTVKSLYDYVEVIDTMHIFDIETYEETVTVTKREIPIEQYYAEYGEYRWAQLELLINERIKHLEISDNASSEDLCVDEKTEEAVFIPTNYMPVDDCYVLDWGGAYMSHRHSLAKKNIHAWLDCPISLKPKSSECDAVESFEFTAIMLSVNSDPVVAHFNSDSPNLSYYILGIGHQFKANLYKIYFENIRINGEIRMPGMVFKIE